MKIPYAARFATIIHLAAALYTWLAMRPGLLMTGEVGERQAWLLEHAAQWRVGWWLWLVGIFAWMLLLVVLSWSYLPAHRVSGALQSGLMIISALLAIAGVNVWMGVLPALLAQPENLVVLLPLADALARTFLTSGVMMGAITTLWITYDLLRQQILPRLLLWPWLLGGCCALFATLVRVSDFLLLATFSLWLLPLLWLALRGRMPDAFPEWRGLP